MPGQPSRHAWPITVATVDSSRQGGQCVHGFDLSRSSSSGGRSVQDGHGPCDQITRAKGFSNETLHRTTRQQALQLASLFAGEAGHEQKRGVVASLPKRACHLCPTHARHDHVAENQVKLTIECLCQAVSAVAGTFDLSLTEVARQRPHSDQPDHFLIVNH